MKSVCFVLILIGITAGAALVPGSALAQRTVKKDSCAAGDCRNGTGLMLYSNGHRYEGQFKDGQPDGKGKMEYAFGAAYDGDFVKGIKHGKGSYRFKSGNRYEGDYVQNRIEGHGVFYYINGDRYEGLFLNGDFDGDGIYHYASGNKYTGTFKKNKKDGNGEFVFASGGRYVGQFKFDAYEGRGTYYFRDGSRYEGDFSQGNKHGRGSYIFKDSSRYEGEFFNDHMQGLGVIRYPNGERYEGQFVSGMSEGTGSYHYANGDKYEGTFKKNDFDGTGTFTTADGIATTVTYRNGQVVSDGLAPDKPLAPVDSLVIERVPTELKVDSPRSHLPTNPSMQPGDARAAHGNKTNEATGDTGLLAHHEQTAEREKKKTVGAVADMVETKSDVITEASKPVKARCGECGGSGKKYFKEETRKRVVTKDISNGVGPKNYVTYTVTDVVRPAGHQTCNVCRGSGLRP